MTRAGAALPALLALAACGGGGANAEAPKTAKYVPPPAQPPLPGWTTAEGPDFVGAMPEPFRRDDAARVFSGERGGTKYTITWGEAPADIDGQAERIFDRAATSFFRACRGVVARIKRDDTLEHKTATIDGTCGDNAPVLGQVHLHGNAVYELYAVVATPKTLDEDELRGFFRAFRLKSQ